MFGWVNVGEGASLLHAVKGGNVYCVFSGVPGIFNVKVHSYWGGMFSAMAIWKWFTLFCCVSPEEVTQLTYHNNVNYILTNTTRVSFCLKWAMCGTRSCLKNKSQSDRTLWLQGPLQLVLWVQQWHLPYINLMTDDYPINSFCPNVFHRRGGIGKVQLHYGRCTMEGNS